MVRFVILPRQSPAVSPFPSTTPRGHSTPNNASGTSPGSNPRCSRQTPTVPVPQTGACSPGYLLERTTVGAEIAVHLIWRFGTLEHRPVQPGTWDRTVDSQPALGTAVKYL